MSKKTLVLVVSAIMLTGILAGCGDSGPAEKSTNNTDKIETQDKADNAEDSEKTSKAITVPVTIINNTQVDIYELYTSGENIEDWGNNIIPNGQVLSPGMQLSQIGFTIDENNLKWDLLAKDSDGNSLEFYGLDLSECSTDGVTISLSYDMNTQTGTITAQ